MQKTPSSKPVSLSPFFGLSEADLGSKIFDFLAALRALMSLIERPEKNNAKMCAARSKLVLLDSLTAVELLFALAQSASELNSKMMLTWSHFLKMIYLINFLPRA